MFKSKKMLKLIIQLIQNQEKYSKSLNNITSNFLNKAKKLTKIK